MKFTVCIDQKTYQQKPNSKAAGQIARRIAKHEILLTMEDLKNKIEYGYTWCPATFFDGQKTKEKHKQQQVFALDFDGGITLQEALDRAKKYEINPAMSYETFSSENYNRFRLVFLYVEPVPYLVANMIQHAFIEIFPEADPSGKDVSKMYYGGYNAILYDNEPFMMVPLIIGLTNCLKEKDEAHYTRRMRTFCSNCRLETINHVIRVDMFESSDGAFPLPSAEGKNGEIQSYSFINIKGENQNSPIWGTIRFISDLSTGNKKNLSNRKVRSKDIVKRKVRKRISNEILDMKCRLFREYYRGIRYLGHQERWLLGTNLIQMKGGKTLFLEILEQYPKFYEEKIEKTYMEIEYMIRNNYHPYKCDKCCTYKEECTHNENMILTVERVRARQMIKLKGYNPPYSNLEDAEIDLRNKVYSAMMEISPGITIIKAQTGIGKTNAYLELLQSSQEPYIIAVPTDNLKEEIYQKAKNMGLSIEKTQSITQFREIPELWNKIQYLYKQGAGKLVTPFLEYWNKKHGDPQVKEYLKSLKKIFSGSHHIVTTHARLIYMKEDTLKKYKVIIDEDILKTAISLESIDIDKIKQIQNIFYEDSDYAKRISKILDYTGNKETYFTIKEGLPSSRFSKEFWKFFLNLKIPVDFNLEILLTSKVFYYDKKNQKLYVMKANFPPIEATKYIMLSATVNQKIYESIYPDHLKFITCKEVQYLGRIIQYHDNTYSRYNIAKQQENFSQIVETHQKENHNIITFKKYSEDGCDAHFGAAEGLNWMEGNDIAIIGTPHYPQFLYQMYGLYFGYTGIENHLSMYEVERNGFRFCFYTYPKGDMRELQLWFIESELEQCVGRARLLRHSATVHLYSNFPVRQTILSEDLPKEL